MVTGVRALHRRLSKVVPAIEAEAEKTITRWADRVVADMKNLAPKDLGDLIESIDWTFGDPPKGALTLGTVKKSKGAVIKATVYAGGSQATKRVQAKDSGTRARDRGRAGTFETNTARLQEFGTINMEAHPFFFPAWRASREGAKRAINNSLRKVIKEI